MPMRRAPKALWAGVAIAMLVPVGLAFAWSMGDIVPVNQRSNGMMQFEARIQAIR